MVVSEGPAWDPDTHRRALVSAVVDWQRTGATTPATEQVAFDLANRCYLPQPASSSELSSALFFVVRQQGLLSEGDLVREADGGLVAVPEAVMAARGRPIPEETWWAAFEAADASTRVEIGRRAVGGGPAELVRQGLEPVAATGDAHAAYLIGAVLRDTDRAAAQQWHRQAAEAGIVPAMAALGDMLVDGDPVAAHEWYLRGTEAGDRDAMNGLAALLVEEDPDGARKLFERAARLGSEVALARLGDLSESDNPEAALAYWRRAAELGHVASMVRLARSLAGTDPDEAQQWLAAAAAAGDVDAAFEHGMSIRERDPGAARALLETAAQGGRVNAMFYLALLITQDDPGQARRWYEEAAGHGNDDAMNNLGVLLEVTDRTAAADWFRQAAAAGSTRAMINQGNLLVGDDKDAAGRWYARAGEAGDVEGMVQAGLLLHHSDPSQAGAWYRRAVDEQGAQAMNLVAIALAEVDPDEADAWTQRAAEAGSGPAAARIGAALEATDPTGAHDWYERGARAGNPDAMNRLANLLVEAEQASATPGFHSDPVRDPLARLFDEKDPGAARRWYERAVARGHVGAMNNLGKLLEARDPVAARDWYRRAAEAGDPVAMSHLAIMLTDDDPAEARRWSERAAAAGSDDAAGKLADQRRRDLRADFTAGLLLAVLLAATSTGFWLLADVGYLSWYLANGPALALVTGLVSLTVDLDRIPNLISPRPHRYLRACRMVLSLPWLAWSPAFFPEGRLSLPGDPGHRSIADGLSVRRTTRTTGPEGTAVHSELHNPLYRLVSDTEELPDAGLWTYVRTAPLTSVVILLALGGFLAWFVVIAPLQYLTNAVVGAPVRRMRGRGLTVHYSAGSHTVRLRRATDAVTQGASEVQFYRRPVTTTLTISSLVLWLLSLAL